MTSSDYQNFVEMLIGLSETYGRKQPTPAAVDIYFNALAHYSIEEVAHGFNLHFRNPDCGQFFPKPADVIRALDGGSGTKADQAWTKVESAIRRVGSWDTVVFDDAVTHAVIADMGGWIALCSVSEDELPFRRNEFVRRHRSYNGRKLDNYPRKLIGAAEAHNSREGHDIDPPVMIGKPEVAALVYQGGSDSSSVGITQMSTKQIGSLLSGLLPEQISETVEEGAA